MSRTRVIYNSEALFLSPSATGSFYSSGTSGTNLITQLTRIQSANYSFNVARTDVNQYGELGRIDAVILTPPTVSLDFTYLLTNVNNEAALGLTVNQGVSCLSGLLSKAQDEKNYFISTAPQGTDDAGFTNNLLRKVLGFGNGFLANYTSTASVGSFATASVSVEALNFAAYATGGGYNPAINPTDGTPAAGTFILPFASSGFAGQISAIRPGDVNILLGNLDLIGADPTDLKVQSYSLSIPLARENIDKLGSLFPSSKDLQVPINTTLSVECVVGDSATGNLSNIFCNDKEYDVTLNLRAPSCPGASGNIAVQYLFKGAKLSNHSYSSSIGPNKTISFEFTSQIAGAGDDSVGVIISGRLDS